MNRSGQLPNLDKLFKDEEEQDFTPHGGSNLAAIFDNPVKSIDVNSSLKSHSPKKISNDKNSIQSQIVNNKTEVIVAKVVHAYKLQNGQYSLIGKLGLALTGNAATNIYVLILYRNKAEHISVAKLTTNFSYTVRENNYATYYDNNNDNWSILFESSEACIEFAREIGLSKYLLNQEKSDDNVLYQDLTTSNEGEEAKEGDKISLKCSIITSITQPLKINTVSIQDTTVEITTDNNWERSLVGTRKNLKRILFLPPSKQISLGPGFPRDKDIAVEIEITDIARSEPAQMPSSNLITSSGKASIISRMARMGQSILPKLPSSTATDSEDTEEEVHIKSPRRLRNLAELSEAQKKIPQNNKPSPSIEQFTDVPIQAGHSRGLQRNAVFSSSNVASPHGTIVATMPFANPWTPAPIQQYLSTVDGQMYPIQSAIPQPVIATVDPNMNVFLSETRTHNAEIRMGMSKIADNVQKLLDKFHVLEVQNAASPNNEQAFESSLKMLLALKNEKTNNDTTETDKISTINESSSVHVSREELKKITDDLDTTKKSLSENLNRLEAAEIEKKNINLEKLALEEKIRKLESSLSDTQSEFQKALDNLKIANDLTIKYQTDNTKLQAKIVTLDEKTKALEDAVTLNKNTTVIQNDKATEIKQIMNKTYQTLIKKFTEDSYTTDYIKTAVAKTIRAVTLHILKENKNNVELHTPNDLLMKESTGNFDKNKSENETVTLPNVGDNLNLGKNMNPAVQDEPPPIPPMDLDIDSDWSL
ncbi:hypothetical protein PV325_013084 [Microctonus aethiopoides]|uniref:FK506-binding protein 15 n=1 Tax=Microctonus aethiopoides TaxID=144406 RepID=A0AA39KSU7_9HYME|nr:hypothetical protein PV325_013084 [Microctonus aethiopoides]KAK0172346.1 hypothetical protein PV328_005678 [Microctonus aethiopoides]